MESAEPFVGEGAAFEKTETGDQTSYKKPKTEAVINLRAIPQARLGGLQDGYDRAA